MGWGRYFLLGDLGQQLDISDQREEIDRLRQEMLRSRSSGAGSTDALRRLQAENDELRLYLAAVIRILVSKGVVTQGEMKQIVDAIDAEDGTVDGKFTGDLR
jgi:polyhydroxyalkanoate synthesis regulator phasin